MQPPIPPVEQLWSGGKQKLNKSWIGGQGGFPPWAVGCRMLAVGWDGFRTGVRQEWAFGGLGRRRAWWGCSSAGGSRSWSSSWWVQHPSHPPPPSPRTLRPPPAQSSENGLKAGAGAGGIGGRGTYIAAVHGGGRVGGQRRARGSGRISLPRQLSRRRWQVERSRLPT